MPARSLPVWDVVVRATHWTLALGCAAAWVTTAVGLRWHEPVGYLALAMAALRIGWGFAGRGYARLAQFVRGPRATLAYAAQLARGEAPRYIGHNPLGGWMAVLLWLWVALLGLTGWLYSTDAFWGEAWLDRTHQALGWSMLALVALHVAGVIHASIRHRENLVAAMLTGVKQPAKPTDVA
ncbi:MAG TPA: cytochrome b/b6 domain-containing protein [Ramlibacter sp.]|uniref:cytochrome b/b6 domain-containing protein n=1 Tax=Ramlibacter sp. TaxID=1917967 RepID=UPI002CD787C9|nr:cytochrome b/b6 domain-containing protein [Ramlibacter sp.]HVZ42821.1 cytochrome b/b6 domain-containing protein [Ramlibacter sp.]